MRPPLRDPEDPREWIGRARSNLARAAAGRPTPEVLYEDLAFDAQQAVRDAASLTPFAAAARYPGVEQVTEERYRDALAIARVVVRWAEQLIHGDQP